MRAFCIFQRIDLASFRSLAFGIAILSTFLFTTACQQEDEGSAFASLSAQHMKAANTWTRRAIREIEFALRDSFTQNTTNTDLYATWLDSLRMADVIVQEAQDRLNTDMTVLDRLIDGTQESEKGKLIKEYWTSDDRLTKLETLFSDAFGYLYPQRNDSSKQFITEQASYWNSLLGFKTKAYQIAGMEGASLELNIAYLDFLEKYRQYIGLPPYPTNELRLILAPSANNLLAGETFRAGVWLSASSVVPKVKYEGDGVYTDSSWAYEAQVKLMAGTDSMPATRSWYQPFEVEVSFFKENGQPEQLFIQDSFKVNRPAVRWYGQQPMYLDCDHRVQIEAPLLGDAFNPSFNAEGGAIVATGDSAVFSLSPSQPDVHLSVFQASPKNSVLLDTFYFACIQPPKPRIVLLVNGKPYTGLTAIPKRSRLVMQVLADPEFEKHFAADAQYGMEAVEVLIQQKPDAPPRSILKFSGKGRSGSQGVPILFDETPVPLPPGTLLYIRAENIFRRNFNGKFISDERFSERDRTVPIVIR